MRLHVFGKAPWRCAVDLSEVVHVEEAQVGTLDRDTGTHTGEMEIGMRVFLRSGVEVAIRDKPSVVFEALASRIVNPKALA